jgi:hypothetical protein
MKLRQINLQRIIFVFLLFSTSIFFNTAFAMQPPDTLWTKTFGGTNIDIGHCVQETTDSGYIITGYTRSYGTMSGRNVILIKTDSNGNEEWINAYGGDDDDEGYSVQQTSDGGYIITGYTKSYGFGLNDVFLIKTDASGNQSWIKTFGGAQDDEGYSVLQTDDGGYLIAGVTSSSGAGSRDVLLVKTDASGNSQWQKTLGGMSSDGARDIKKTSDGGYILTGWTLSYGPGFIGNAWLVKTDSLGNEEWNKFFGGSDADRGYSVQQTNDGGYIVAGYTDSFGAGLYDMLLVKTDNSGNQEWMKTFGGTGRDYGHSVQQTTDGGFIVAGYTLSFGAGGDDVWLVKTDINGTEEWNKPLGGTSSDVAYSVKETSDGGCIVTGHTLSFGAGVHDVWLIKMDYIIPVELASFTSSVNGNTVTLNWITATEINNSGFEIQRSVFRGQDSNKYNWETIGFVKGNGTTTETIYYSFIDENVSTGNYSYRLKQIDYDGTFEYSDIINVSVELPNKFSLFQNYPNPFNPSTNISFIIPEVSEVNLSVYDMLGNKVRTLIDGKKQPGTYEIEFNAEGLSSGMYFYRLSSGKYNSTKKLVLLK